MGLAVLIVLQQALGLGAVWPQELAQPRMDEEISKQEKIFQRRGADVPSGYVTSRALSDYAELLPTGFCDALGRLGSSDRWLDIGAGEGRMRREQLGSRRHTIQGTRRLHVTNPRRVARGMAEYAIAVPLPSRRLFLP